MTLRAVIFDLDGVIVSTDDCHYRAWQRMADEEGLPFDRERNELLRGVSRMESLALILEQSPREYTPAEKQELAARKNGYYRDLIRELTGHDLLPGALQFMEDLRARGLKLAVASSSKNTPAILELIGLAYYFDAVADGNDISRSKPYPEVFLLAATRLGIPPEECVVVEDAEAGVQGALAAGMRVLAVGSAAGSDLATWSAENLAVVKAKDLLQG